MDEDVSQRSSSSSIHPPDWPKVPLGLLHLAEEGARLDDLHRRFLETVCRRPYSFYAVTAVAPGRSLALRDVLTDSYTVLERQASQTLHEGDILFTRIVPLDAPCVPRDIFRRVAG